MSMYSCCLCGTAVHTPMMTITQWGLSPNVCTECLSEVNACIEPPRHLLVTQDSYDEVQNKNHKEETISEQ